MKKRQRAKRRRAWGSAQAELATKLSPETLAELTAKFAGRRVRVPAASQLRRAERVNRVHALLDDDSSYRDAAVELGVSLNTVVRDAKRAT